MGHHHQRTTENQEFLLHLGKGQVNSAGDGRVKGGVSKILRKNKIQTYTKVMLPSHHFWVSVYVWW